MFIFRTREASTGVTHYALHTGDFRASAGLIGRLKEFQREGGGIAFDAIYLDTTYAHPQHTFASQEAAIASACAAIDRLVLRSDARAIVPIRRLVVIGAYLVGKERLVLAIAALLGCKVYCSPRKRAILKCLEWEALSDALTADPAEARVHIVGMGELDEKVCGTSTTLHLLGQATDSLSVHLYAHAQKSVGALLDRHWPTFTHALAVRPTGWTFGGGPSPPAGGDPGGGGGGAARLAFGNHVRGASKVVRRDAIARLAVPYSEHSSFDELVAFLGALWGSFCCIIPTVDNAGDLLLSPEDYSDAVQMLTRWHLHTASTRK